MVDSIVPSEGTVRWRQVITFLVLTVALTLIVIYPCITMRLPEGLSDESRTGLIAQLQAYVAIGLPLIPGVVATALCLFVFRSSPIHVRIFKETPRLFFFGFLTFAAIWLIIPFPSVLGIASSGSPLVVLDSSLRYSRIMGALAVLTIPAFWILIAAVRVASGRALFAQAGLSAGKAAHWLVYGLLSLIMLAGVTLLAGAISGLRFHATWGSSGVFSAAAGSTAFAIVTVAATAYFPLWGWEYGWRVYLQSELVKLGIAKGLLLTALVVSLIQSPLGFVNLIGLRSVPSQAPDLAQFLLRLLFANLLRALVLGYAFLKTRSVWLVAFITSLDKALALLYPLLFSPQ